MTIIYILSKDEKIIGHLSNSAPNGTPYYDDTEIVRIAESNQRQWGHTLSLKVPSQYPEAELLEFGNKLLIESITGKWCMFTIDEVSEEINGETHLKTVDVAYNSFLVDMRNYGFFHEEKTYNPANTSEIIRELCSTAGWDFGELTNLYVGAAKSFTISRGSALANLDAFLGEFDIDVEAYIEIDQGQIKSKQVRFSKARDEEKAPTARFEYRRDLASASRRKSSNDFATMLYAYTMPDSEGNRKSIASVNEIVNPYTGVKEKLPYVYDKEANDRYNDGRNYIVNVIESEIYGTEEATLVWAKEQLKYWNHPKYEYTVAVDTFQDKPNLGDKVEVVDLEMTPPLAIEAIVIGLEGSKSDPSKDAIVLGEYKEVEIKTISSIASLQSQLAQLNKKTKKYEINEYTTELDETHTRLFVIVREDGVKMNLPDEVYTWRRTALNTNTIDDSWTATGPMIDIYTADYEQFYYECVVLIDIDGFDLILRTDFKLAMSEHIKNVAKYDNENTITLGFITDTHYDPNDVRTERKETAARALQYENNLIEASKHISYDALIHGGDIIDGRKASPATAKMDLDSAVGVYREAKAPRLFCRGNHDSNPLFYKDGGKSADKYNASGFIKQTEANNIMKQFFAQDGVIDGGGMYGAYEVPNKNTSLIFLDSYDLSEKVDGNDKRQYVSGEKEAYGAQQLEWLADYLNSLPLGQDIVVFTHAPLTRPNNAANETINRQLVIDILNAWRTGGTETFTSTREDYEVSFTKTFVGNTGRLIATIAGHNHADTAERDTLFGGTVPSFTRTCGFQGEKDGRVMDTLTETAFDTIVIDKATTSIRFLRFGAGSDKYVNYTLTTDITTGNDVEEPTEPED